MSKNEFAPSPCLRWTTTVGFPCSMGFRIGIRPHPILDRIPSSWEYVTYHESSHTCFSTPGETTSGFLRKSQAPRKSGPRPTCGWMSGLAQLPSSRRFQGSKKRALWVAKSLQIVGEVRTSSYLQGKKVHDLEKE